MANGLRHGVNERNLKLLKSFLTDKYAISDDLALQVLTHKSFANGIKPYNEKLSTMGLKLLNLYLAKFVLSGQSQNDLAINGINLDVMGLPMAKELGGRTLVGLCAKQTGLTSAMFWKSYNPQLSFEKSGELKVSAQMMYAMVGAVTFVHGKEKAEQFVLERLLDKLEAITAELVE